MSLNKKPTVKMLREYLESKEPTESVGTIDRCPIACAMIHNGAMESSFCSTTLPKTLRRFIKLVDSKLWIKWNGWRFATSKAALELLKRAERP